jgi:signal transduction histidine kinase/ActR/RegA family two-component response regulator
MFDYISRLLDSRSLSPHGFCLLWRPELLWTHVVSDALIFAAYMTIPAALAVIIRKRQDIPYGWVIWCFALFITACGFTHFMGIWTLWRPDYGIEALVKAVTAIASVATAVCLWWLIPLAVAIPSPAHLREVNQELERRIEERDQAILALRKEKEERQKAEAALIQAQKMDALGHLTGGIAHDFNNLLQAIQGSLDMIARRAADPDKVRQLAEGGTEAAQRGARLTGQLLAFSRTKQLKLEPFYPAELVSGMREMLARTLGPSVDLKFDLSPDESPVLTDRNQAELALLNLVINARDAAACHMTIKTERYVAEAAGPDLNPGVYMALSVTDDGAGMSPEVAQKAFDPFFTTKAVGHGTGLGLSQVYGFARQSGGTARIDTAPGKGACVTLLIPAAPEAAKAPAESETTSPTAPPPLAKILVVDDDDAVRATAVEALANLGLQVSDVSSGAAAVQAVASDRPDLILLDYAMPDMTGAEVAQAARALWPDLKIIFVTGYADLQQLDHVIGPQETTLRKPYRLAELQAAISHALVDGDAPETVSRDAQTLDVDAESQP